MPAEEASLAESIGGWLSRTVALGRAVIELAADTQISLLAAALAYYAFVSAVPFVVLGVVLATTIGGDALADRVIAVAGRLLAPAGQELLRTAVTARSGLGGVTLAGLLVLLWGALRAFRAMDIAFSLVYGHSPRSFTVESFADAFVALSIVGVGVLVTLLASALVAFLPAPFVGPVSAVGLFVLLLVAFFPLYYLFPGVPVSAREVLPGAVLAALGWAVLGTAFGLYAASIVEASVYGLLGGVILALAWLYLGALLLLLGAAVNAVRSGHAPPVDR